MNPVLPLQKKSQGLKFYKIVLVVFLIVSNFGLTEAINEIKQYILETNKYVLKELYGPNTKLYCVVVVLQFMISKC